MSRIVECVPNFSEGRRREVVDQMVQCVASVPGTTFLDSEMDPDHHRSVLTFAGEPEAVIEAVVRAVRRAAELIDLNHHSGQHPRMGAADVIPFVPVEGLGLEDCVDIARRAGSRIGDELGIPVFLYEAAATRPDRVSLADVRRGQFEGLRELIGTDPRYRPDFGPESMHPTAGATAVGARRFLIAFNANLNTGDVRVAKAIAAAIREQSGGLKHVRALGFSIEGGRRAQVSMNLVNTEATPIHRVLALIQSEAVRFGAAISGCEVVGLIPEGALLDAAEHALRLEYFRRDQVLELRLRRPPISDGVPIGTFLDQVSAATPTPGGGTAAALVGALAASLAVMVARLTLGKKRYAASEAAMRQVICEAEALRLELMGLGRRDSEAFEGVIKARRLPETDADEAGIKARTLAEAELEAARIPRRTAEACLATVNLAEQVARLGNVHAVSDAGVAGLLGRAAGEAALLNVQINLKSLVESADKDDIHRGLQRLQESLGSASQRCAEAVHAGLDA